MADLAQGSALRVLVARLLPPAGIAAALILAANLVSWLVGALPPGFV